MNIQIKHFSLKFAHSQVAKMDGQKGHKRTFTYSCLLKNEKNPFPKSIAAASSEGM